MFFYQMPALLVLTVYLALHPSVVTTAAQRGEWWAWAVAVLAAGVNFAGSISFFRGLQVGTLAVVSPVAACYAAVTVVLALTTGDHLTRLAGIGIVATIAGIALVSAPADGQVHATGKSGLGWALGAATGFGVGFWLQGVFAVPSLGSVIPIWLYYATGTTTFGLGALITKRSLALPGKGVRLTAVGAGLLGVTAYAAFTAGLATGHVSIVTVLSSLATAVTVLIACVVLRERLAIHQWAGVAAIIGGVVLINAGR
jgi:drug/metabolite transporter (DMT)-like permease